MLLWIEGFEGFGTTTGNAPSPVGVVGRKYALIGRESDMTVEDGRLSGYALKLNSDSACFFRPEALTTDATMVVGCAIKFTQWPGSATPFLILYDGSTLGMAVRLTAGGEIAVYRSTTLLDITSGLGLLTNTWFYLEFKVVCGDSGSYEVRINGQTVLSGSADTKVGSHDYHTTFQLQGLSTLSAYRIFYDDLYCLDGSGSVNDFLGPRRVVAIFPDAAGDSAQFTPDSGDNYARVNAQVADDDTSYVESATTGHKDLYNYGALSGITGGIDGVQVNTTVRQTDVTEFSLTTVCKSDSTESDDTPQVIGSTDYVIKRRILATDPNTGAAWSADGVNGAQFGVKVG